jgi:hypothetical protein
MAEPGGRESRRARAAWIAVVVLGLGAVVAAYGGTFMETRWSGTLAPCTRSTDIDGSTWQNGVATMRAFPPAVHCRFVSTIGDPESARDLPAAASQHVALLGIVSVAAVECAVAAILGTVAIGVRRNRRWQSAPTSA